ncbi:MAG: L-threonylcarbamoyladenylate synthase [Promethearchaeota archaeon]
MEEEIDIFLDLILDHIIEGKLIAFPTDSVYGIGGDPSNIELINRIYDIKHREHSKGFLLLVSDFEEACKIAEFNAKAKTIAKTFWPGQVTLILRKKEKAPIPPELNAFQDTIGLRVPKNEIVLKILRGLKKRGKIGAIIGTSANFSREPPAISGTEVSKLFMGTIDLVLDSGKTMSKIPTTIVDLSSNIEKFLRIGRISERQIRNTLSSAD